MKRNKIAEWLGDYFTMIVAIFIALSITGVAAWPIGFLCKQIVDLFKHGYSVW